MLLLELLLLLLMLLWLWEAHLYIPLPPYISMWARRPLETAACLDSRPKVIIKIRQETGHYARRKASPVEVITLLLFNDRKGRRPLRCARAPLVFSRPHKMCKKFSSIRQQMEMTSHASSVMHHSRLVSSRNDVKDKNQVLLGLALSESFNKFIGCNFLS